MERARKLNKIFGGAFLGGEGYCEWAKDVDGHRELVRSHPGGTLRKERS